MGCLRTLGCLTLLALLALGGWMTRDRWLPAITGERPARAISFDVVNDARRERARTVLRSLEKGTGPVFANLTAAEALALLLTDRATRLPALVGEVEAAVAANRLLLRAVIDPSSLSAVDALGPAAALLRSRQRVTLSGTLEVREPGEGVYVVEGVTINDLALPTPAIPPLIRQLDRRRLAADSSGRGIAFPLPRSVADVRVAKGRITLYKRVP